jgi:hypothetical protein
VWAGTLTGLAGLVLLGVAASLRSWWWTAAGLVLVVAGLGAARHGRIWRDVHASGRRSGSQDGEIERIRRGGVEEGVRPGEMIDDPRVRQDSRQTEATHRSAVHASHPGAWLGPAGGVLLVCAAAVLLAAQLSMFPNTRLGEENATFLVAPTAVLALCGLNAVGRPAQGHHVGGVLGLLAGAVVVLVGLVNPHQLVGTQLLQLVCGAAGILGAVPLLSSR